MLRSDVAHQDGKAPAPASPMVRPWLFARALISIVSLLGALACGGATAPDPAISRFDVVPSTIEVGEPATLKAAYSGGSGRVDPLGIPVPSGLDVPLQAASSTEYTLTVTGPGGAKAARASLTVKPGLLVKVEGLPAGLDAAVTVVGPGGFSRTLTNTTALKGLAPGHYTVSASTVMEASTPRYPLRLSQEVDLTTTGALVKISYPAPTLSFKLPGEVALDFVLIPPGSFMMGAVHPEQTADWPGAAPYAMPRHEVTFAKAFYLAKFPVTTRQWKAVTGWTTPDYATKDPDVAVWNRDWFEWHQDFLAPLDKLVPGQAFRLPSEAEWEYALRAGSTTKYFWGDDFAQVDTYCWTQDTTTGIGNLWPKVGLKQPNAWGLHDMFTVTQWTEDDYHLNYIGAPTDGSTWLDNPRPVWRTARGAGWAFYSSAQPDQKYFFNSAYRSGLGLHPATDIGLRLTMNITE